MTKQVLTRFWLVGAVTLAVAAAILFPGGAAPLADYYIVDGAVVVVMFLGSLKISSQSFAAVFKRPQLLLLSVLSVFALSPAVSLVLARIVGFSAPEEIAAVLLCSAQASTLATAVVLTEVAGGNVALAMVITVVNNTATVFLTPLVFELAAGARVEVDGLVMAREMAVKLLAPVVLAQLQRRWIGAFAERHRRRLSITSQVIILLYIYTGVAAATHLEGSRTIFVRLGVLVLALHGIMLAVNALVARVATRDPGSRAAFVLTSSQKTLPAAILVWKSCFPTLPLGPVAAVMHHVLQLVVDSVLAPRFLGLPLVRNRATHDLRGDDQTGGGNT